MVPNGGGDPEEMTSACPAYGGVAESTVLLRCSSGHCKRKQQRVLDAHCVQWEHLQFREKELNKVTLIILDPKALSPACPLKPQTPLSPWVGKMAQQEKVLAAKADDLSLVPMVEEENCFYKLRFALHMSTSVSTHNK